MGDVDEGQEDVFFFVISQGFDIEWRHCNYNLYNIILLEEWLVLIFRNMTANVKA